MSIPSPPLQTISDPVIEGTVKDLSCLRGLAESDCQVEPGLPGPVSYTHLDVYKRQALVLATELREPLVGGGKLLVHQGSDVVFDNVHSFTFSLSLFR